MAPDMRRAWPRTWVAHTAPDMGSGLAPEREGEAACRRERAGGTSLHVLPR
jgi:hypothetical protein